MCQACIQCFIYKIASSGELLLQMRHLRFRGNKSLSQVSIERICQSLFFDSSYELSSVAFLVFYTFHIGFLVFLVLIDYVFFQRSFFSSSKRDTYKNSLKPLSLKPRCFKEMFNILEVASSYSLSVEK